MAELLDPNGVWDLELVNLMLPVALEMETNSSEATFVAMSAVVSGLMDSKGPKAFIDMLAKTKQAVRNSQRAARGLDPVVMPGTSTADQFTELFKSLERSGRVGRKRG